MYVRSDSLQPDPLQAEGMAMADPRRAPVESPLRPADRRPVREIRWHSHVRMGRFGARDAVGIKPTGPILAEKRSISPYLS
jgi:hypothetical protein